MNVELRDYFAGQALAGLTSGFTTTQAAWKSIQVEDQDYMKETVPELVAKLAFELADQMLAARDRA